MKLNIISGALAFIATSSMMVVEGQMSPSFGLVASKPGWKYDRGTVVLVKNKLYLDSTSPSHFKGALNSNDGTVTLASSNNQIQVQNDSSMTITPSTNADGTENFSISLEAAKLLYKNDATFSACRVGRYRPAFELLVGAHAACKDGSIPDLLGLVAYNEEGIPMVRRPDILNTLSNNVHHAKHSTAELNSNTSVVSNNSSNHSNSSISGTSPINSSNKALLTLTMALIVALFI